MTGTRCRSGSGQSEISASASSPGRGGVAENVGVAKRWQRASARAREELPEEALFRAHEGGLFKLAGMEPV